MDIESRLTAIEALQRKILTLLNEANPKGNEVMNLRQASEYVGYSTHHFRRLAVEQRVIPFTRPSGLQHGKLIFRKIDLDKFLELATHREGRLSAQGRRRKSKRSMYW